MSLLARSGPALRSRESKENIAPDGGGNDAFVHITAVERAGFRSLRQDQRVSYDLQEDRSGKMSAVNLKAAEDDAGAAEAPQAE